MDTKIFDNISSLWGEDLKSNLKKEQKYKSQLPVFPYMPTKN